MSALWVWLVMGAALVAYTVTAGADYGGGVWDLFARGAQRDHVKKAVERAIAPIWEANHVWLIFLVVMMFTVFPRAFAVLATALHIPITVALIGMVLRGAAFVLRAYGMDTAQHRVQWGVAFGVSSLVTPVVLGMCLAAVASGDIRVTGSLVTSGFFAGWLTPFAVATGVFALALFMLLSAVYLAYDAPDVDAPHARDIRAHFRRRALVMELVSFAASLLVLWRASVDAPTLYASLVETRWAIPAQLVVFALAVATSVALLRSRYGWARLLVAAQVSVIVIGFGLAMDGHIVMPDVSLHNAGTRAEVLGPLGPALAIAGALVVPSLWFLFRLFKTHRT
jgi:cytochrome d ubiquinol oxidase subunit II